MSASFTSKPNPFIGTVLLERFTVSEELDCDGYSGTLFTLSEDQAPTDLLAKISDDIVAGENEMQILMSLQGNYYFPDTVEGGKITI